MEFNSGFKGLISPPITKDQIYLYQYPTNCRLSHIVSTTYLMVVRAESTLSIEIPIIYQPSCNNFFHFA